MKPLPTDITGLVLAGGRSARMGGIDKGLQRYRDGTLAQHALQRLAPQVQSVAVSANRHADAYAALGAPVWPDTVPDLPGPLAGLLTGLERCDTEWLASVPCDAPWFPVDLVRRLAAGLGSAALAVATVESADGPPRRQPVFCLMHRSLAPALRRHLAAGQRRASAWVDACHGIDVPFADATAFVNVNTLAELERLDAQR